MTVLSSSYLGSTHRPQVAEYRRQGYFCNGWNKVRRWNGRSATLETAGISGPARTADSWTPAPTTAAGNSTVGRHVFRYRYQDSRTGYVSNPSEEREVEIVATGEKLTFPIGASGSGAANIIRSSDSKVDKILLEVSVVGDGATFFLAAEAANTASTIVFDLIDESLEEEILPWPDYGHDPPPIAKNILSHRDRIWLYSQVTHETGNCTVNNGSTHVDAGASAPEWIDEALGASSGESSVPWLFQRDGDAEVYEIDYYDSGNDRLVLKTSYAGTSGTNVNYRIFSRTDVLWVSAPGFPEGFVPLEFLNGPNGEGAGDLTAAVGYASSVILFSRAAMFKFTWDQGPQTDGFYTPLSAQHGALNQRVVLEVEGRVYAMDRRGWSAWEGVFPQTISRPVDPYRDEIDYSLSDRFHACWFPDIRAIRWFVCYTGETYPKHFFQLDVDTGAWSTGEYLQGISDSRLITDVNGQRRVMLGDENGHTWFADTGVADGVPATFAHLTDLGGSTTTVIAAEETLPTTGVGLAGCFLTKRTASGGAESRLIESNTEALITLASAFSAAPVAGDSLWVGSIPTKLKTKAFRSVKSPGRVKRTNYLVVVFEPVTDQRLLQVRVYEDLSSTAKAWATARNDLPGVTFPGNNADYPTSDWLVDLSTSEGVVSFNIGSEFKRFFEIELEILEPDADFRLLGLEFEGDSVRDMGS